MIKTYKFTFDSKFTNVSIVHINANSMQSALSQFYERINVPSTIKNIEEYTTPCYYKGVYDDGEEAIFYYEDKSNLFYWASKYYAFNDIDSSFTINEIVCDGRKVKYAGWKPGMHFVFKDAETNEVIWETWHQEWDH